MEGVGAFFSLSFHSRFLYAPVFYRSGKNGETVIKPVALTEAIERETERILQRSQNLFRFQGSCLGRPVVVVAMGAKVIDQ